jgi:hypothetical protein
VDLTPPALTQAAANPSQLRFTGGNVEISASAIDSGSGVAQVWATITSPSGAQQRLDLNNQEGTTRYSAILSVPASARFDGVPVSYTIQIHASDQNANTAGSGSLTVTIDAAMPPPPIPLP